MKRQIINGFEQAVDYLLNVPRFTAKNSLQDTRLFLDELGSPDRGMHIVHVAGTNGKGSVCAYLRSILEHAGKRVAFFTSPHLVDIRERFVVDGKMVSKEKFLEAFLLIYHRLDWDMLEKGEGYHPTFFEYLFLMAMVLFREAEPDYCILETGLGGRLDATNSVAGKDLAVITRISLDHVEYLGNTIRSIAGEKAGILHPEAPAVFADVEPEASEVICKRACELGIQIYPVSKNDYTFLGFQNKSIDFSLNSRYYGYIGLTLSTIASYQAENAAVAVRAAEVLLGTEIGVDAIRSGLRDCFWAGRMEEVLPEVYVDGAHNEDGIRAFLDTVRMDGFQGRRRLLFSVVGDKDYKHMLEKLLGSGLFNQVAAARLRTGRAASMEDIGKILAGYPGCRYSCYEDTVTALRGLLDGQGSDRIYIAGSLYLAGEIKEYLNHD